MKEFEQLKDSSVGHSLLKAARLYNEYSISIVKKKLRNEDFKPAYLQLFPHIPFEGITIVELAAKLGISKQAVSVMVKELLKTKILIKLDNPHDKRSFLITFNTKKNAALFSAMKELKKLDSLLIDLIGSSQSRTFDRNLKKIIDLLN